MLVRSALVLSLVLLSACTSSRPPVGGSVEFDEITVRRINVIGPDGSYRVVLAGEDRFPDPVIGGREYSPRDIAPAGLAFFGLDGDEVGAIVVTGDSARHNAMLVLDYSNADGPRLLSNDRGAGGYIAGLVVADRRPLDADEVWGASPTRVGAVVNNGTSYVVLNDGRGKERLILSVSEAGEAQILFLDGEGNVVRTIAADGADAVGE